ncbi:MAG: hypothetical protein A3F70_02295 [Acidobacteria bacterium RIFCSPLOWO2_12_FULL_67_14]|nr:MAG: hypothetical protein A3F70_02295 [Acidobacteria bacterium RIFCSPLOWO2_12_FULL_67_14]
MKVAPGGRPLARRKSALAPLPAAWPVTVNVTTSPASTVRLPMASSSGRKRFTASTRISRSANAPDESDTTNFSM